ncbi:LysR family transcriptional regulator [Burkholderiales bacterium 8X]|nr:LysR family transcriptional regulator [Burkholderiales bacterium 8X]
MNLRTLDLNLLLIFDAIYNERSISKAALKLHLSQPTVSNALARLRERLQDELFERSSQGMLPTVRAKTLAEPIRQALDVLERGFRADDQFDFANSDREFVIAVEDYGETIILPRFVDWLAKVAPRIRIRIRPESAALLKGEMRDGSVDLALDYFTLRENGFSNTCVLTETLLSLSRRDHPVVAERLSLETYLSLRHVVLAPRTSMMPMIDLALSKRGQKRHIAVTVPHFLSMPMMVQTSDMICTLPRRMAHLYADHFHLKAHTVPLRIPRFPVYVIWHDSVDGDASHQWFRNHLVEFCQRL